MPQSEKNFTSQSSEKSSENSKPREKSCHHERHLSGIALKVYNVFWRLGKKSKDGFVSMTNARLAKLVHARVGPEFKANGEPRRQADHLSRVKTALARAGWLEFDGVSKGAKTGTWSGGRYRAVSHKDWAVAKVKELRYSPCHPEPLQVKVSSVKPGGRGFRSGFREDAEVRTAQQAEVRTAGSHRAEQEVRTDCVVGSTRAVRSGKYAQSVDFGSTGVSKETRRAGSVDQQGEYPPAPPKSPNQPTQPERQGGVNPSQTLPERREEKTKEKTAVKQAEGQTAAHAKPSHKEPTEAPALNRGQILLMQCDKELAERGVGPELFSDPSVHCYREMFLMAPWLSFGQRMAELRNEARFHRVKIHPKLLEARKAVSA